MKAKELAELAFDLQVGLAGADVPEFDAAKLIGNAAVLAVNLRGLPEVDFEVLKLVAAHYFKIRSETIASVLEVLADLELVRLITSGRTISRVIPQVPHFDDVYEIVGDYTAHVTINETEQVSIEILRRLLNSPMNRDALRAKVGADASLFSKSLDIGTRAGLVIDRRARGRDIVVSPLYFSGNLDGLIDVAARGQANELARLLTLVKSNQGMPLSFYATGKTIGGHTLIDEEAQLIQALSREGIIKPPSVIRPNATEERFVFTPMPGNARLSSANREIYEKAMALAAAIRKGQLLPENIRIRSPDAILSKLQTSKMIGASTEAAHQYKNLTALGLGRLEKVNGDFYNFRLIDVQENVDAVRIARELLSGGAPKNLERDEAARALLIEDQVHVRSHISSNAMRSQPAPTIMSGAADRQVEQFMLAL